MGYKINKGFMWVREPEIPDEYQEVEYIESSGTQYIDTGIIGENKYRVNTKFTFTDLGGTSEDLTVIGSTGTSRPSYMTYIKKRGNYGHYWSQMVGSDYQTATWSNPSIAANTEYTVEAKLSTSGNYLTVNGTKNTWSYTSAYNCGYSMYMFASNNGGTVGNQMKGKIFYLRIYDLSENPVRDFVPCYRKSDNVIGMYDKVEGKFYTNTGTGTFTKGNDVDPTYEFKEKQFYPGAGPTTKEETFTLSNLSAGGGTMRYDNIAVDGDIVEIEFNGTLNCPSSSSTWADAQIGFTQSNSGDGQPGIFKTWQIGYNRTYYGDQGNDLNLSLSSSDNMSVLIQKTPAGTGSYAIKIVLNSEGVAIESGTNQTTHSWTSSEASRFESIISGVSYCKVYGTQMSWTNMTVKVKYV